MNKKNLAYRINLILIKLLYHFEDLVSSNVFLLLVWYRQQFAADYKSWRTRENMIPPYRMNQHLLIPPSRL